MLDVLDDYLGILNNGALRSIDSIFEMISRSINNNKVVKKKKKDDNCHQWCLIIS